MYQEDLKYLCCPKTGEDLELSSIEESDIDGEIISGILKSVSSGNEYPISNGIPRFIFDMDYNKTWDYKWTQIDKGKGINFKIADKNSPAYLMHDIFDRNDHNGKAFLHAKDKVVLDLGCGVGQYTLRMLQDYQPLKVVSMDLTRGVDIMRKVFLERFPQYKQQLLLVQANVFAMPFRKETFDYVFSLGVLHHTGNTIEAIRKASHVVKYGGQLNFWIYASEPIPYSVGEPNRKVDIQIDRSLIKGYIQFRIIYKWINSFRKMPHEKAVKIVKYFSSDFWYRLCYVKNIFLISALARFIFSPVGAPDFDYRFINNYDGWINTWDETWNEHEIFPVLEECDIAILGISNWRLGFWGTKKRGFYS